MAFRNLSTSSIITGTKSSKLWDQTTLPGFFESINTVFLASNQATVEFNNIPQVYKHLQVRMFAHATFISSPGLSIYMNFNSDVLQNYSYHQVRGNGGSVEPLGNGSQTKVFFPRILPDGNASTTNVFGASIWDILDYRSTNKNKTVRCFAGYDTNNVTSGHVSLNSSTWLNQNNPIINIAITTDAVFTANSHFALYGIRG